jgi:hypothetical protein
MSMFATPETKRSANELAERLGVTIPGDIRIEFWSLPILEALLARIEALEAKESK